MSLLRPKIILTAIVLLVIIGYAYNRMHALVTGPIITVTKPKDGASVEKQFVTVRGEAENVNALFLNGRRIFTNTRGMFEEEILLFRGYNKIELAAEGRFGREIKRTLEIMHK